MHDLVGADKNHQHRGQYHKILQIIRHRLATQDLPQHPAAGDAQHHTAGNDTGKGQQAMTQAQFVGAGHHEAVHHHRQQRADRIDDDAFPAQDVGHRGRRAHHPQHGHDHGWPGHQGQGPQQDRHFPAQLQQVVTGHGNHDPGDQRPQGHHAPHYLADIPPFRQVQGQTAFEQDQGDGNGHDGEQHGAEQGPGIEQTANRPRHNAAQQQQQDRR